MGLARHAKKNKKTTLLGILAGVSVIIGGVTDFTALPWEELLTRALKAAPVVYLGLKASDTEEDEPRRKRKDDFERVEPT